jgi:hypothetical protein
MNQWLADLFLSLPRALAEPLVFGSLMLILCWLCYAFYLRAPIARAVRRRCGDERGIPPMRRLLYGAVRKRARLDEGGLYLGNQAAFLSLSCVSAIHVVLFIFARDGLKGCGIADRVLLTITVLAVGALSLATQPRATIERRERWGFGKGNAVLHAAIWELLIVVFVLLWLYDAWFLPAFAI